MEFTDRYGGRPPSWLRGCFGDCEATGYVPIHASRLPDEYREAWVKAEAGEHAEDGWHFVPCPRCRGTGRVSWPATILRIPFWIYRGVVFLFTSPTAGRRRTLKDVVLAFKCAFLADLGLWRSER